MSFDTFARACGLDVRDLTPSRHIRRCGTIAHPRSKNGAYLWDGERGWAFAWDGDAQPHWYGEKREWSEADKRQWATEREADRRRLEMRHVNASKRAYALIAQARLDTHGYLRLKGFADAKALCIDEDLIIPMRDMASNLVMGAQVIRWLSHERKWEKKMLSGMRAKGSVLRLGPPRASAKIFCEGYATGLSIMAAAQQLRMDACIVVCFSDSNLAYVASKSSGHGLVYADHDASGAGQRAAESTGLPWCMPDAEGWDANDLHTGRGLMAVCAQLMNLRALATA